MPYRLCFSISKKSATSLGNRLCIEIPIRIPVPGPKFSLGLDGRPFELGHDLQTLATIADLSRELSPDFRKSLGSGIEEAFCNLRERLPEGMELNSTDASAPAAAAA